METPAMSDPRDTAYPIGKYPAVNQDVFLVARANAIQAYAKLEFSLSIVFSRLLGTQPDIAGLVFFRITNTYQRNGILEDLKKHRFGNEYNLFWNSIMKIIRQIDQRRNEIVHWHVVNDLSPRISSKNE
jgi:RecB family exonuclease